MKNKFALLLLSSLMALALALTGCAPATTPTTTPTAPTIPTPSTAPTAPITPAQEKPQQEAVKPAEEKPKYGGTFTDIGSDPTGWDVALTGSGPGPGPVHFYAETLLNEDWKKGPAGTGETGWLRGHLGQVSLLTGALAESWELPDDGTVVFRIRKGIKWQNIAPVNGREFTAEDARWNLERTWKSPLSYVYINYTAVRVGPTSIKTLDKYTVELKVPAAMQGIVGLIASGLEYMNMYAPEVVAKYGDARDWRNAVGTGPFILKDYVPGSLITFVRNPNYWQSDPLHPENQLPYFDTYRQLIIPDKSTQLAAFRTGKVDVIRSLGVEDYQSLRRYNPGLKYLKEILIAYQPWGRMDKPELPFKDIRVRQALNMAINRQELVDEYYEGETEVFSAPFPNTPDFKPFFTPWEEQSQAVKDLFTYNPKRAKQLLAEAGYPNGFKTNIVVRPVDVDLASIVREYFLAIGVDMAIKPLETAVYNSVNTGRTHEQMIWSWNGGLYNIPYKMGMTRIESHDNDAFYQNPRTDKAYEEMNKWIGRDDTKWAKVVKDITPFIIEEALGVWLPGPPGFYAWWPWVQNYHGEAYSAGGAVPNLVHYIWIDEALKKSMGY